MKNGKRTLASIFVTITAIGALAAQTAAPMAETPVAVHSRLLFVTCPVLAEVWIDGESRGQTPVVLDLPAGIHVLKVVAGDLVDLKALSCDGGGSAPQALGEAMSRYEASLHPRYARLSLKANLEGASVTMDGLSVGQVGKTAKALPGLIPGRHELVATADGMAELRVSVTLDPDSSSSLVLAFEKGYPLVFSPALPSGTVIEVLGPDGMPSSTYLPGSGRLFPAGSLALRLRCPGLEAFLMEGDPASGQPFRSGGTLAIGKLPKGTLVELDGAPIEPSGLHGNLDVPLGFHILVFRTPGMYPAFVYCPVGPGSVIQANPVFTANPAIAAENARKLALPLILSGLAIMGGGYYVNLDDTAIGLSTDYESYKLVKYLGLGAMGLGLAGSALGLVFVLTP